MKIMNRIIKVQTKYKYIERVIEELNLNPQFKSNKFNRH